MSLFKTGQTDEELPELDYGVAAFLGMIVSIIITIWATSKVGEDSTVFGALIVWLVSFAGFTWLFKNILVFIFIGAIFLIIYVLMWIF